MSFPGDLETEISELFEDGSIPDFDTVDGPLSAIRQKIEKMKFSSHKMTVEAATETDSYSGEKNDPGLVEKKNG